MPDLLRRLTAEFLGIFTICFAGILAITHGGPGAAGELTGIALAFGLAVAVMVSCFAAVSGAHFNPAATLALLLAGRIATHQAFAYVLAQVAGATAAAGLLAVLFDAGTAASGCTVLAPGVTVLQGSILEFCATFTLLLVIFGTAVHKDAPRGMFPWAIGLCVTLDILAIGPLTGAGLNPARSIGPALVSGTWDAHWVYWLGTLGGAAAAALVSKCLFRIPNR